MTTTTERKAAGGATQQLPGGRNVRRNAWNDDDDDDLFLSAVTARHFRSFGDPSYIYLYKNIYIHIYIGYSRHCKHRRLRLSIVSHYGVLLGITAYFFALRVLFVIMGVVRDGFKDSNLQIIKLDLLV